MQPCKSVLFLLPKQKVFCIFKLGSLLPVVKGHQADLMSIQQRQEFLVKEHNYNKFATVLNFRNMICSCCSHRSNNLLGSLCLLNIIFQIQKGAAEKVWSSACGLTALWLPPHSTSSPLRCLQEQRGSHVFTNLSPDTHSLNKHSPKHCWLPWQCYWPE